MIKKLLNCIAYIAVLTLFVFTCQAVDESSFKTEQNAEFYVEVLLGNPSNIGGKYIMISESSLKESILASIPEDFKWGNAKIDYKLERPEIDISEPISEYMFLVGMIQKGVSISMGQIPIDPLTSIELLGYATGTPTTPPEIVASIGNKMIESKRLSDIMVFDYRMRNSGFFPSPFSFGSTSSMYQKTIPDGILVPPSTTLVLEIPLKAPPTIGEYNIDLNIPYWYTTTSVPNPSIWDGRHIDNETVTITKVVIVEGDNSQNVDTGGNRIVISKNGHIEAKVVSTSASGDAGFGISSPVNRNIFTSCQRSIGQVVDAGYFTSGTELIFYADTTWTGKRFLSTDVSNCRVTKTGTDVWLLEWEDSTDYDFNDFVISVKII